MVLNENNRAVVALLVGFVVGVVVGFDGAFAVFSMMFGPLAANFGTHFRKVSLNSSSQKEELVLEFDSDTHKG